MASTATIFSVMLLLSLFMSTTFVSAAARQLNESPKVTRDQNANSEKSKVETGSTKAEDKTSLSDKKFFIPIPIPIPFPLPQNFPGLPRTPSLLPGPAGDLPSLTPPVPEN